jgi:hypothetical protein
MRRLLEGLLLMTPRDLSAREFVPPLRLRNPFSSVEMVQSRPLQALQFHYRAIVHGNPFLSPNLFLFFASESL